MDIYELLHDAIYEEDLLASADKLIIFADTALKEKNKVTLIKHFYERLNEWGLMNYAFTGITDKKKYLVYSGREAKAAYFALSIPSKTTPVKSLQGIREFAHYVISHFVQPVGEVIDEQSIHKIMDYLDAEFDFSNNVFSRTPIFAILNYTNVDFNSFSLFLKGNNYLAQHIFLSHMKLKAEKTTTPESVFFHELGHALSVSFTGDFEILPNELIEILEKSCFPKLQSLPFQSQCEVFADVLSVGMMYDSPFQVFNPFPQMHKDDMACFKKIVNIMVSNIPKKGL